MHFLSSQFLCLTTITTAFAIAQASSQPRQIIWPTYYPPQQYGAQQMNPPPPKPHKKKTSSSLTKPLKTHKVAGKTEVALNATLPLKGEISIIGKQIFDGMTLFFNKIKKEDKNSPIFVNLSMLNDHADIVKIRKNTRTLLKKSPLFASFFGPESLTAISKYIQQQKLAIFFPLDGMEKFRKPEYSNIVYFRPPHDDELSALINYSINVLNKKKIAVFYEASEWGEECYGIIKNILKKKYHIKPIAKGSYQQKTVNIAAAVNTIAAAAPNAIICIAQARPAYNFVRQVLNKGLHKTTFLGLGQLFTIQSTLKKSRGIGMVTSSVVPDPIKSNLGIAKEYRADMKKYFPNKPLTPFSLEGYINAAIFYAALSYTQPPLSAQKIIETITLFNAFNFKGLTLTFDEETRALSSSVWINTGSQDAWFLSPTT